MEVNPIDKQGQTLNKQNDLRPLVSIMVPSYNHKKYIQECIESIYNCGYQNLQVIVIDDNSSDGSKDLLKSLQENFGFELLLKDTNKGLVDSLNTGLKQIIKGKYYKFVPSDDILIKGAVESAVTFFEDNNDIEVVIGKAIGLDEHSNHFRTYIPKIKGALSYKNFLLGKITYNITAVIYRTNIHKKIGYYQEGAISEDIYLSRKLWKHCKISFLDIFISGYRTHGTNTSKDTWLMYQEGLKALEELKGDEYYHLKKQREYLNYFVALSKNHKREAIKYFLPSLRFFYERLFLIGLVNLVGLNNLIKK